jgi:hypothetical protein
MTVSPFAKYEIVCVYECVVCLAKSNLANVQMKQADVDKQTDILRVRAPPGLFQPLHLVNGWLPVTGMTRPGREPDTS